MLGRTTDTINTSIDDTAVSAIEFPTSPKPSGAERRCHARRVFEAEVSIESQHTFYTGFAQNISSGGLFVATHDILPLGTKVDLSFTIPTWHQPIAVTCEVRWQRPNRMADGSYEPGMGVSFLTLTPEERGAVDAYIAQNQTLFWED